MKKYATSLVLVGIIIVLAAVLAGVLLYLKNQPPQQRSFQPITTVKALEPEAVKKLFRQACAWAAGLDPKD